MGCRHLLSHLNRLVYVSLVVVASWSERPGTILAFFDTCKAVIARIGLVLLCLLLRSSLRLAEFLFQVGYVVGLDTLRIVHRHQEFVCRCCSFSIHLKSTVAEAAGGLASIVLSKRSREAIALGIFVHLLDGHRLKHLLSVDRASASPQYFLVVGIGQCRGVDCCHSLTRLHCHRCILNLDLSLVMPTRIFWGMHVFSPRWNILARDLVHILC